MAVSGMIANASASCFVEFDAKISISGDTVVLSARLFVYRYLCNVSYFSIIGTKNYSSVPNIFSLNSRITLSPSLLGTPSSKSSFIT